MVKYCKETGEEQKPNGDCLLHEKQQEDHFILEPDNRSCKVCGKRFWCEDNILRVCSMRCAGEYAKSRL